MSLDIHKTDLIQVQVFQPQIQWQLSCCKTNRIGIIKREEMSKDCGFDLWLNIAYGNAKHFCNSYCISSSWSDLLFFRIVQKYKCQRSRSSSLNSWPYPEDLAWWSYRNFPLYSNFFSFSTGVFTDHLLFLAFAQSNS